ncbi:MAG TPA: alanine racemase [Acidimicrobiales bacterium]|nr:alanine racemase [Acidimicrobiales bacterium]
MDAGLVAERVDEARRRIERAAAAPVTVVAVTKGFGSGAVVAALQAGLADIGENYAHELLAKLASAPPGIRWHFLGALQRNKLAGLAPHVHLWHSLDSGRRARALALCRPGAPVLVEVRVAGVAPRLGVPPAEVPGLVEVAAAAGLEVRGLMAVGPRGAESGEVRAAYRGVARLARSLGLKELSMGMSADFELAVAEGATIVRLGEALFGQRRGG